MIQKTLQSLVMIFLLMMISGCFGRDTVLQTETQVIAIEESLSQPCDIEAFPEIFTLSQKERVEILKQEYFEALGVIGKCELQRKESLDATRKLKQLYTE